jgi:kynurenine formamidase
LPSASISAKLALEYREEGPRVLLDLSVKVPRAMWREIFQNEKMTSLGHLGTHFDVADQEFRLANLRRRGRVFDVRGAAGRDVEARDLDAARIEKDDFILLYTGFLQQEGYGTPRYFRSHPQLSRELIELLLGKRVSLIGIDAAGIRRGAEHTPIDRSCAQRGVFIVENLTNLDLLLQKAGDAAFEVFTFPIHFEGLSGLPCRVVAELSG